MNILTIISANVWGGGEQYVYDISSALNANSKQFFLIDYKNSIMKKKFANVGVIKLVNFKKVKGLLCLNEVTKYIKENKIEAVHCHSGRDIMFAILLKKITGVKVIFFKHNVVKSKKDFYHNYIRKECDAIICVSELVYKMQTAGLKSKEKQNFHKIYNGVRCDRFNKYSNIKKDEGMFIIGYAGRITKNKGINVLIDAFVHINKKYPNTYLKIAGQDENGYLEELKKNKLNKNIIFEGFVNDMEKFYKQLDLLVLPTLVPEAFGLVLCEAMYCGTLVLTSSIGAQKEIITNDINGYLMDDVTKKQLIEKIVYIIENKSKCEDIAKNGKIHIKNKFTISKTVEKLLNIGAI